MSAAFKDYTYSLTSRTFQKRYLDKCSSLILLFVYFSKTYKHVWWLIAVLWAHDPIENGMIRKCGRKSTVFRVIWV
jgi:hypothetical protein